MKNKDKQALIVIEAALKDGAELTVMNRKHQTFVVGSTKGDTKKYFCIEKYIDLEDYENDSRSEFINPDSEDNFKKYEKQRGLYAGDNPLIAAHHLLASCGINLARTQAIEFFRDKYVKRHQS